MLQIFQKIAMNAASLFLAMLMLFLLLYLLGFKKHPSESSGCSCGGNNAGAGISDTSYDPFQYIIR